MAAPFVAGPLSEAWRTRFAQVECSHSDSRNLHYRLGQQLGNQDRKDAGQFLSSICLYVNMIQQKQGRLSALSGRGYSEYDRREQLHDARRQFGDFDLINLRLEAPSALVELFEAL